MFQSDAGGGSSAPLDADAYAAAAAEGREAAEAAADPGLIAVGEAAAADADFVYAALANNEAVQDLLSLVLKGSTAEEKKTARLADVALKAAADRALREVRARVGGAEAAEGMDLPPMTTSEGVAYYRGVAGATLVEGVVPKVGTGATFGPSGAAKTTILVRRALCMASGQSWFGRAVNERVGTLLVAFEDGHELPAKVAATAREMGCEDVADWVVMLTEPVLSVTSEASVTRFYAKVEAVRAAMAERGIRLGVVVFDTQRHMHAGHSVNDDAATSRVTSVLTTVSKRWGVYAEVISHTPVADDGRVVGSGEQKGAKSLQLLVNKGLVKVEKSRHQTSGVVLGGFELVSIPSEEWTGIPRSTVGVALELSPLATAEALAVAEKSADTVERDANTRRAILEICSVPPVDDRGKELLGWSDTKVANALRDRAKREVSPENVHTHRQKYVKPELDAMGEEGLIVNMETTQDNGKSNLWLTTERGRRELSNLT